MHLKTCHTPVKNLIIDEAETWAEKNKDASGYVDPNSLEEWIRVFRKLVLQSLRERD